MPIYTWCEQEGAVKYHDCRELVFLKTNNGTRPIQHSLRTFTCNYRKTTDGKYTIGGECVAVALSQAECLTAYIYERESDIKCMKNGHAEEDGKCHCNHGYSYNDIARQCVQTTGGAVSDLEGQLRVQPARQEAPETKTATEVRPGKSYAQEF